MTATTEHASQFSSPSPERKPLHWGQAMPRAKTAPLRHGLLTEPGATGAATELAGQARSDDTLPQSLGLGPGPGVGGLTYARWPLPTPDGGRPLPSATGRAHPGPCAPRLASAPGALARPTPRQGPAYALLGWLGSCRG